MTIDLKSEGGGERGRERELSSFKNYFIYFIIL